MKSVDFPADTRYGRIYFKNPERESYMNNKKETVWKDDGSDCSFGAVLWHDSIGGAFRNRGHRTDSTEG